MSREYLPHGPVLRTDVRRSVERKVPYSRAARRASRAAGPALGGWGIYATIIAFGLAVCLTGYLAIGDSERAFYPGRASVAPVVPGGSQDDAVVRVDARVDTAARAGATMPSLAVDAEGYYEPVAEEHLAIFESLAVAPLAIPDRKAARERRGGRDASAAFGAMNGRKVRIEPTPSPAATLPVAVAAPTAPSDSVPTDRWQQLASAQLRCERENVIAGLVCKERTRLQYCEGEWGAAPQCPAAVLSLNTR